jgi:transcriptional regulator with XRE-family HTH domain
MTTEIFEQNLAELIGEDANVSEICEKMGVNRTQFNKYRYSGRIPRIDALIKICDYFNVDARILTTPLAEIQGLSRTRDPMSCSSSSQGED